LIAIIISLYFYNKSNKTEKEVSKSLIEISKQTKLLDDISFKLIDKLIDISAKGESTRFELVFDTLNRLITESNKPLSFKESIHQTTEAISQDISPENIEKEVTVAYLKNLLLPHGNHVIKTIYYHLEGTLKIELNRHQKYVRVYRKDDFIFESDSLFFLNFFFKLHVSKLISITSMEPFNFKVSNDIEKAIKQLYKELDE